MAGTATSKRRRRRTDRWVPITVAITLAVAVAVAAKTPPVALYNPDDLVIRQPSPSLTLARPRIAYEVGGHGDARVSYITGSGELAVATVRLPWSLDLEMSSPMRPASVTATALAGGALTCRLDVDGVEQDAREAEPDAGVVLCSVVSA